MYGCCYALVVALGPASTEAGVSAPEVVRAAEQAMAQRPLEAFAIARRAADNLAERPDLVKGLFATGARVQEERLALLSQAQAAELAHTYDKTLGDKAAAERVLQRWLKSRLEALGPADGPGRLEAARLTFLWFRDRAEAARLCQEALRVAPELAAAARMLREDLNYRLTETGWQPREHIQPLDRAGNVRRVRPGMTPAEVRRLLGPPDRIARQILYRRYLEQWIYDDPPALRIVFDCLKGQEPHVQTVHAPTDSKP
jgi:hypothetical protein